MIRRLSTFAILGLLVVGLQGCGEKKKEASEQPVRGLRAYKVAATAESRVRRFPSVLQPADVSSLSFEIGGQLKAVTPDRRPEGATWRRACRDRSEIAAEPGGPSQRGRAAGAGAARQRSVRFPAQGRAPEAGRRDAGGLRTVQRHSAQLKSPARPGATTARTGQPKPRPKQAAGPLRRHHSSRRGQILRPSRCGAAGRHALQRRQLRNVLSGAGCDVPEPQGRTKGRRQGRRQARPSAQRRDQGARIEGRAGVGLSGRGQAGQQRPGSERRHVR